MLVIRRVSYYDEDGCALLCILEAVEGRFCSLEVQSSGGWLLFVGDAGGDTLRATLYARGCGGDVRFAGGAVK